MLVENANFFQTYSNNPPGKPQHETAELKTKTTTKIRNQNRKAKTHIHYFGATTTKASENLTKPNRISLLVLEV